jgi:hypothetical protein
MSELFNNGFKYSNQEYLLKHDYVVVKKSAFIRPPYAYEALEEIKYYCRFFDQNKDLSIAGFTG